MRASEIGKIAPRLNQHPRKILGFESPADLSREAKRAQRWNPGPGSLGEVMSDANDFRRRH